MIDFTEKLLNNKVQPDIWQEGFLCMLCKEQNPNRSRLPFYHTFVITDDLINFCFNA